jgi:lipoprotein-anchoring transpeptidase ErfK/SrfK
MPRTLILAAIPLLAFSCGGEENPPASADVVNIPLGAADANADENANSSLPPSQAQLSNSSPTAGGGTGAVTTPPAGNTQEPVHVQPAAAKLDSSTALSGVDSWHRELAEQRSRALSGGSALANELSGFAGIFSGKADAYRASLKNNSSSAFGSDFERYGSAWASGGVAGLQRALASGPVGTAKMVWTDALIEFSLAKDDYQSAGTALATVIHDMLGAGYSRERVLELTDRVDLVGRNAAKFLPSTDYVVTSGDSYWKICRKFREQGVIAPQGWIAEFNHKRNYNLRAEESLKIPTSKLEVKGWRQSRLMVLYADRVPIRLYAVSMGQAAKPTPLGAFTLSRELLEEPIYYPSGGMPVPYANPDNPLGERWMGFQEDRQYGIHGTNSEDTIGSFESGGCIRMHNEDAIELFELVAPGVKVTIYA